ncbi:tetratricopeptide repeat protein [Agrobacterium tumefaciens]|uniref:hypothetical protein n=1 Tax=Agrobacterium tumefaciens TaxID=358 RepID=UPI0015727425|nr:hypothetical protein [Agrobacterium tumefaciens]MEA1842785.1 hypothetical protein [Agrobacterium tumefaciens]WCK20079.1 hypothetical protein G6M09_013515 [Agrobacterium tumefaciens]
MRNYSSILVTMLPLLVGFSGVGWAQDAVRIVDGRINVRDGELRPVFLDDLKFYPGTKVKLDVAFRVDVMRWMYETRECWTKLFGGVWCEYIKQSSGSGIRQDAAPLIIDLFEAAGRPMASPVRTAPARIVANTSYFDASAHLPPNTDTFSIVLDDADIQDAFNRGYTLRGRVATNYRSGESYPSVVRSPCAPHRNNEHCSQGEYVVNITAVDTSEREKMLERYLARKRSYSEISGPDVIDRFMRSEVSDGTIKSRPRVQRAAELLVQHAREHHQTQSGVKNEDLRQILEFAVSLDQENVDARNNLVRYHIEAGNLAQAKERGAENLKKFSEAYETGRKDSDTLKGLAQSLRNGGQIMLKDRAAVDLADVEAANGFFEEGLAVWAEYESAGHPVDAAERIEIAQLHVDQARVLGLIRTATAQQRAIRKLELARLQLPKKGTGTPTAVSGAHFLTASFFQPLAEVANARVFAGYLPSEHLSPLQVRHSTGEILFRRLDAGRPLYWRWSSRRPLSTEQVVPLPADLTLKDGRFFGEGLIGIDANKGELVTVKEGIATTLASDIEGDVRWSTAQDAMVVAYTRSASDGKVTIWRDEKSMVLETGSATIERVAVSPSGTHVQVLRRVESGLEILLVDLEKLAKGEEGSPTYHRFSMPDDVSPELLFTQDGLHALQQTSAHLTILPTSGGEMKVVALPANSSIHAVGGGRLAIINGDGAGMAGSISSLDTTEAYESAVPVVRFGDASLPQMKTLNFLARIPAGDLVVTGKASSDQAAEAPLVLLAKELPAVLQVHSATGPQVPEQRVASWRHGDAVLLPGGKFMAIRDRQAKKVRLVDLCNSIDVDSFPGETTKLGNPVADIIPIVGSQTAGFFLILRDPVTDGVVSVTTYPEPKKDWGLRYELPEAVMPSGSRAVWKFLRQPTGHLVLDQARVTFIAVDPNSSRATPDPQLTREEQDEAAAAAGPVKLVTIEGTGRVSAGERQAGHAESVVAPLGDGIIEQRATGFAFLGPGAEPVYLDDCGATTLIGDCDQAMLAFSADGNTVTVARQGREALDLASWSTSPMKGISIDWQCRSCRAVTRNAFDNLDRDFVGAQPYATFAMDSGGRVLTAYETGLGLGASSDDRWLRKIPFARPVAVVGGMALVQREGGSFELWQGASDGAR